MSTLNRQGRRENAPPLAALQKRSFTEGLRCFVMTMDFSQSPFVVRSLLRICALSLGTVIVSCVNAESSASTLDLAGAPPGVTNTGIPAVLATVGDEEITLADLRARVGEQLDQAENRYLQQRHKILDETLRQMVRDRILSAEAKKHGLSISELVREETGSALDVSDAEVQAWYSENRSQVGNRGLEQVRSQIVEFLKANRREAAIQAIEERVGGELVVGYHLEPFRVELNNEGSPSYGPSDAAVTLVEFSDFECPFCKRFFPTLKRIENEYGDRVRIVYRQFPLSNLHPSAFKAAEASLCAHEQGEFWAFHDLLFEEQHRLGVRDLKEKAGRLGLDRKDFNTCLDSGRYVEQVQEDLREGRTVGVTGTPALFVNGIVIEGGAVGFDVVSGLIDKELASRGQ